MSLRILPRTHHSPTAGSGSLQRWLSSERHSCLGVPKTQRLIYSRQAPSRKVCLKKTKQEVRARGLRGGLGRVLQALGQGGGGSWASPSSSTRLAGEASSTQAARRRREGTLSEHLVLRCPGDGALSIFAHYMGPQSTLRQPMAPRSPLAAKRGLEERGPLWFTCDPLLTPPPWTRIRPSHVSVRSSPAGTLECHPPCPFPPPIHPSSPRCC